MATEITKEIAQKVLDTVDAGLIAGLGTPVPGDMCVEAAVTFALGEKFSDEPSCVNGVIRSLKIKLNDSAWSSNAARAHGMRKLAILQLGTDIWGKKEEKQFVNSVVLMTINDILPLVLETIKNFDPALIVACRKAKTIKVALAAARAALAATYAAAGTAYWVAADAAARLAVWADAAAADYATDAAAAAAESARLAVWADAAAAAYATDAAAAAEFARLAVWADAAADEILTLFSNKVADILIKMNVPGVAWLELL